MKTEGFSFRFLLSDRNAITGDARSERLDGRAFPDLRRPTGGGQFLGKTVSEQAGLMRLVIQEREKAQLHQSTSEVPLPVALLLIRLVCFQHANGAKGQRKRQFCIEIFSFLR